MLIQNNWLAGKSVTEICLKLKLKKNFVKYYIKKNDSNKLQKSKIRMKTLKRAYFYCVKKNKPGLRSISKKYSDLLKKRMEKKNYISKQMNIYLLKKIIVKKLLTA